METLSPPSSAVVSELGDAVSLARVFAGISEPARLQILLLLLEGEYNVGELVSRTGISQGRVSVHLQCLRHCGFVTSERRGKFVYYRVRDGRVKELIRVAQELMVLHGEHLASCAVLDSETTAKGREGSDDA